MSVRDPLAATPRAATLRLRSPDVTARRTSTSRAGLVALGGLLAGGALISVSAAQTDALLPESVRPVPGWLAGPLGTSGPGLGVIGLIAVLSLMLGCYVIAARTAERLSARTVLLSILGLHALMLLAPALVSTDIFSYQAYGRMGALYGANPYLQGPHAIALDPIYPFIGAKWVSIASAYGPLFTLLSYVLAPLSIATSVLAYKSIAVLASLAIVGFTWQSARLRGIDPIKAAALVGLNPLLVLYGVGGGHNDLLMLAVATAGVYAFLARRERLTGSLIAVAAGVKLTALLVLPFALAAGGHGLHRARRRDLALGAATAGGAIASVAFAVFGVGPLHLVATLVISQSKGDWHSIPGFISTRLGLSPVGHVAGVVLAFAFLGVLGWLLRQVRRAQMDWIDGAAWATAAMLVTASALLPWYVAWLMPLVALAADRRLFKVGLWLTVVVQAIQMLGYIPHASSVLGL